MKRRERREAQRAFAVGLQDQRNGKLPNPGRTTNGAHIDAAYMDGYRHGEATSEAWAEVCEAAAAAEVARRFYEPKIERLYSYPRDSLDLS